MLRLYNTHSSKGQITTKWSTIKEVAASSNSFSTSTLSGAVSKQWRRDVNSSKLFITEIEGRQSF